MSRIANTFADLQAKGMAVESEGAQVVLTDLNDKDGEKAAEGVPDNAARAQPSVTLQTE